jgi:hypothetical protein
MSELIANAIWPGAVLERAIFGTDDPNEIWARVLEACPNAVGCFAFEVSVGARFGLLLRSGEKVALKIHAGREDQTRLQAVQRIQEHLWRRGFPCPRPLGVKDRATLEEWRDEGVYRDAHEPDVRRVVAQHLARLFRITAELQPVAGLEPFFPPPGGPLWPKPHNALFDFEATAGGAEWIEDLARAARRARDSRAGELAIGHGDWSVKHFRFDGLRPTVIYDWDSLGADVEAVCVGGAAASFTYTEHLPVAVWPTVAEARAFIDDYVEARGTPFAPEERRAGEAAAVYSRAYSARCAHAVGADVAPLELPEFAAAFL